MFQYTLSSVEEWRKYSKLVIGVQAKYLILLHKPGRAKQDILEANTMWRGDTNSLALGKGVREMMKKFELLGNGTRNAKILGK